MKCTERKSVPKNRMKEVRFFRSDEEAPDFSPQTKPKETMPLRKRYPRRKRCSIKILPFKFCPLYLVSSSNPGKINFLKKGVKVHSVEAKKGGLAHWFGERALLKKQVPYARGSVRRHTQCKPLPT